MPDQQYKLALAVQLPPHPPLTFYLSIFHFSASQVQEHVKNVLSPTCTSHAAQTICQPVLDITPQEWFDPERLSNLTVHLKLSHPMAFADSP